MIKIVFLLSLILSQVNGNVFLKLNTNGHLSQIRDVIVTKNKNIITASDDKTIKVWNSKTGKEIKKFLGEISNGSKGKIFSIALNKQETYLAAGGFLTGKNIGIIRIYNYKTGKLYKILKSHKNTLNDLSFDKSGKYLISCGHDGSSKIWDISKDFRLKETIHLWTNKDKLQNRFILKNNKIYAVITGGNKIILYDIQKQRIYKQYLVNYNIDFLSVSDKHIAISGNSTQIHIFNYNLERIKTIYTKTASWGISYNKSGTELLLGALDAGLKLYDVKKDYKLIRIFKEQYSFILPQILDKNTIISAGGDNFSIKLWDKKTGRLKRTIKSIGDKVWTVGIKDNLIGLSNNWSRNKGKGQIKKVINLNNFKITKYENKIKFKRISSIKGYKTLTIEKKNQSILKIQDYGKLTGKIIKDYTNGKYHNCYGWYNDFIVSGGINGFLKIYNMQGQEIANLVGHTGSILSIAIDGNRLVSGSNDQTIKVWDLSKIGILKNIYPILNLFITKNNEYVAYTNDGFFDASKNGAKYIGYHINQGINKEAEFVTVDALYKTFYRPDLIQNALRGGILEKYAKNINIEKLLQNGLAPEVHILTKKTNTKNQDMNLKVQVCPKNKGGYNNLTLTINDTPVSVINTSRALKLKRKSKRDDCFIYNQTISLIGGKNTIGFKATNKIGNIESKPDFLEVTFDDTKLKRKLRNKLSKISGNQNINNLHILAIAVNKYEDKELQLKYSISDATQILKTIKKVAKPLFNKIYTYKLFDKDVTKQNIKNIFKTIKSTREDVFLLYIAGHGTTDEYNGNYYYIPYDFVNKANKNAVQNQGIGQRDFMLGLSHITALKSLVLLDTCNSGSFVEANVQKTTTNRLAKATGRATISASSKFQVALEGYKGHGVFTYTLLEALKGKGYKNDSKITINELDEYVEKVLPKRTNDKWGYRQIPQSSMYGVNFNIGEK